MGAWGIFGVVAGAVAVLVAVILLLPLRFSLCVASGNTAVRLRLLGVDLLRKKEKPKTEKTENPLKKQLAQTKKAVKEDGFVPAIRAAFRLLRALTEIFKKAVSHATVTRLSVTAIPAGNAAATALEYGAACAAIYPAVALLRSKLRFKKNAENIAVRCDFEAEQSCFALDFEVSLRLIFALAAALSLGRTLKENKKTGEKK